MEMRWGTRSFSSVSTGDSEIPSSCSMKDEPAFKSLQGTLALLRVRASQWAFHLGQQTQGPSHIPIAERSLLLRSDWKVGSPLEVKQWHEPSSKNDLWYTELFHIVAVTLGFL